jgi:4-amino-4-deoxy-L-arabinose transferase-like glycosyltransferase
MIQVVNTPLGFFVLALLIVESFLATVLIGGNLQPDDKLLGMWLGIGLFILVTSAVFTLVWYKPENLTFDKEAHLIDHGRIYGSESHCVTNLEQLSEERVSPSGDGIVPGKGGAA